MTVLYNVKNGHSTEDPSEMGYIKKCSSLYMSDIESIQGRRATATDSRDQAINEEIIKKRR